MGYVGAARMPPIRTTTARQGQTCREAGTQSQGSQTTEMAQLPKEVFMRRVTRRPDTSRSLAAATHIYLCLLDENWDRLDDFQRRELVRRALTAAKRIVPALAVVPPLQPTAS